VVGDGELVYEVIEVFVFGCVDWFDEVELLFGSGGDGCYYGV